MSKAFSIAVARKYILGLLFDLSARQQTCLQEIWRDEDTMLQNVRTSHVQAYTGVGRIGAPPEEITGPAAPSLEEALEQALASLLRDGLVMREELPGSSSLIPKYNYGLTEAGRQFVATQMTINPPAYQREFIIKKIRTCRTSDPGRGEGMRP